MASLKVAYPVSTGILPHSLPEWALRARPGLWRICLCPKVARIAEHKFGSRYGKVRAKILFPYWAPNLVPNNAINLGAQLGPVSITKLSPNWACQMGPIQLIKFLLSGSPGRPLLRQYLDDGVVENIDQSAL